MTEEMPPGPERRQYPINERLINDLLDSVRDTHTRVVTMDKALAVNTQRQETFYQRIEHLEQRQELANQEQRAWRDQFKQHQSEYEQKQDERQKEYEQRLQWTIGQIKGIHWAIAVLIAIGAMVKWGVDIWYRVGGG